MITRRHALRLAIPLGLAASLALPGSAVSADSNALTAQGFTLVGSAPEAAAEPTAGGRAIKTLQTYGGKVYYGHGDYDDNTGSMTGRGTAVAYYDPASGSFGTALSGFPTEEINTFREVDGKLYAPAIDPSAGAGATNSYAEVAPPWRVNGAGSSSVHIFDVAGGAGRMFLATGDADGGGVWESADGGTSWKRGLLGADPTNDGWERYYWLGTIGDTVFTRLHHGADNYSRTSSLMRYDPRKGWTPVRGSSEFARWTTRGSDVQSFAGRLWAPDWYVLETFNGSKTSSVNPGVGIIRAITPAADGNLYVLGGNGVARIDSRGRVTPLVLTAPEALADATSIAVTGGRLYVGTVDATLYSRPL